MATAYEKHQAKLEALRKQIAALESKGEKFGKLEALAKDVKQQVQDEGLSMSDLIAMLKGSSTRKASTTSKAKGGDKPYQEGVTYTDPKTKQSWDSSKRGRKPAFVAEVMSLPLEEAKKRFAALS